MNTNRTQAQIELNFTKEQGIENQTLQLNEFKRVLKPEAFAILCKLVTARNNVASDGFDIVRGVGINRVLIDQVIPFFQ